MHALSAAIFAVCAAIGLMKTRELHAEGQPRGKSGRRGDSAPACRGDDSAFSRFIADNRLLIGVAAGLTAWTFGVCLWPARWWLVLAGSSFIGWTAHALIGKVLACLARRRLADFERQLVTALALIKTGLRSGRGFLQCIDSVTRELEEPIRYEFRLFLRQHRMGQDISECSESLRRRVPSDELALLLVSVEVNQKVGGNLSAIIEHIENTIRARFELRENLQVITAQSRFEAGIMAASPFAIAGLLAFIDPGLMAPMLRQPAGWMALGAVVCLVAAGYAIMRRIVRI